MWFKREMNPNVYNNLGAPMNESIWIFSGPLERGIMAPPLKKLSFELFAERHN
jgi:hypothetical protein